MAPGWTVKGSTGAPASGQEAFSVTIKLCTQAV